ncbi:MAG: VWA domain-containing protein [Vicinamibacterales bacterium]
MATAHYGVMSLTWSAPAALWLLLAVPLVWLAHLVARTNFNPRQRAVQAVVRSLLLVALALGLARPVISRSSSRQSVVYAVDVSHSVASHAIDAAARKIAELNDELRPAHSRIVAFGKTAVPVGSADALRRFAEVEAGTSGSPGPDRAGTDLEAGLLAARSELAPEHVPRLVIFSDGHATAGDTNAAIAHLALARVPVSVEPMSPRSIGDTWIDSLGIPDRVSAGGMFAATVAIGSQRDGAAMIELRSGKTVLARRPASFTKGVTTVTLDAVLDAPGGHVLQATIAVDGDPLSANNAIVRETWADTRARVLYVEGTLASARYLAGALTEAGFDVTVQPPSRLPSTAAELDRFDVVILSDVGRAAIPDATMSALSEWVEKDGGGLLVAGGEAVFGEGGQRGYRKTPIERLTPVTFERRDEPEVALVIVLDRSWSMAGASMDLTKTAAQAAVDVLSDEQSIGILTFNDKFAWDVPVRNVGKHRDPIREKIDAIGPGGHTLIYPAVEQAYLALRNARARAKHVILLSDGRSYPGEYEALVRKMVDARITVSTVAVGPSADPELLRNLARWGQGRAYVVADATQVPEIFVKEAKSAVTPAFDEKPITPVVKTPGFLAGLDLSKMPVLKGRTATVLKDTALELVATDEDDPLLAFWPIGLGRTAVFASDVKDRWAANWVRWRGYGPFFASVVRALERQRTPALALDVTPGPIRGSTRSIRIAVEARDGTGEYRNLLNPTIQVEPPGQAPVTVPTRQVAPGRYEATVVADASQLLVVSVAGAGASGAGITSRAVIPDAAAEYRFRPPDDELLQALASATGGAWRPTAEALANTAGDSRTERRPLWPALIALALVLWFVDLLLRRVRIFEPGKGDLDAPGSTSVSVASR